MDTTQGLGNRIRLLDLILLTLFATACNGSPAPSPISPPTRMDTPITMTITPSVPSAPPMATPENRSTIQLAADYFSAIAISDRTHLNSLIGADAWCTTPDTADTVKKHLEEFSSAQIRDFEVKVLDIMGWVAYPPGSEAARISFEYQESDSEAWIPASMVVVTVQSTITKTRIICDVTD